MSIKNFLLDCFFPKKCYGCGAPDIWLCQKCFRSLQAYKGEIPRALNNNHDLIIAGEYKDALLHDLITAFKFNLNQELAIPLFAFLKNKIDQKLILNILTKNEWQNVLVIPIPLHKKRQKFRGFNQSKLIANEISLYYSWPLNLNLIKNKASAVQADLSEEARLNNQTGVFTWQGESLEGHDVILIDDIITSGATMNEAENTLICAGARKVIKVAIAKG